MKEKRFFVAVLAITRHFGGPEEGGWWYDWTDVDAIHERRSRSAARRLARHLRDDAARHAPRWNRFSVLGGEDTEVVISRDLGKIDALQMRRAPRYE